MTPGTPDVLSIAKEGDLGSFISISAEHLKLCGTGPEAARDKYNGYCIHWAAGCGHLACLKWLVEVAFADPSYPCKGSERQPSHYAARNGHIGCLKYLLNDCGCDLNALAKHEVSPLQLAVWQNQKHIAEFLCDSPVNASPMQVNSFECSLVHWLATATPEVGGSGGVLLLPMAEWLLEQGCDFHAIQRSGHTPLHKAAWGGHLVLCRWLHFTLGVMDCVTDNAGNFAADCASMGRHLEVSQWLRDFCSTQRDDSLRMLGLDPSLGRPSGELRALILGEETDIMSNEYNEYNENIGPTTACAEECDRGHDLSVLIRNAYLEKARLYHPDRNIGAEAEAAEAFGAVQRAYEHLTIHRGRGQQRNERHDIKTMISAFASVDVTVNSGDQSMSWDNSEGQDNRATNKELQSVADSAASGQNQGGSSLLMFFKARLLATLLDYGSCGMPASSLRKKWNEIWPDDSFPSSEEMGKIMDQCKGAGSRSRNKCKKIKLLSFLREVASDCCRVEDSQAGVEPLLFALPGH